MPPAKRKAPDAVNGRANKRAASGVNTPVSMGSSDDAYSETGTPVDEEENEALQSPPLP